MAYVLQSFQLFVIAIPGWLNRQQQAVIDYLIEENRVLKDHLDGQRLRFTDEQRIQPAVKAKVLGRRALDEIETLVTPERTGESPKRAPMQRCVRRLFRAGLQYR